MKKIVIAVVATSLLAASALHSHASVFIPPPPPPVTPPPASSGLSGGAIATLAFTFASTVSLMTCSIVVAQYCKREMNNNEALAAAGLPFSCLFVFGGQPPQDPKRDPRCRAP
jgi:hypothetical protein